MNIVGKSVTVTTADLLDNFILETDYHPWIQYLYISTLDLLLRLSYCIKPQLSIAICTHYKSDAVHLLFRDPAALFS